LVIHEFNKPNYYSFAKTVQLSSLVPWKWQFMGHL